MSLDAELRQLLKAMRLVVLVETTEDATLSSDGRWEVGVQLVDPPTAEETVCEVAGVDEARAPKSGEQWLAIMLRGSLAEGYLLRRVPRPGDLVETDAGVYTITPPEGEDVKIRVRGSGKVTIQTDGAASINLGSVSPQFTVAVAEKVAQILTMRDAQFGSHTHVVVSPLIPLGPVPSAPPIPSALGSGDMSSTKVKAD